MGPCPSAQARCSSVTDQVWDLQITGLEEKALPRFFVLAGERGLAFIDAQGFLMPLCSVLTPGGAQRTICDAEDGTRVGPAACKASAFPTLLNSSDTGPPGLTGSWSDGFTFHTNHARGSEHTPVNPKMKRK